MVISENLFEKILLEPMHQKANKLCVVSGYATAAMVFRHMQHANENGLNINLKLLVGMCPSDGLSESNHQGFKKLVEDDFHGSFECSYIFARPSVHSKVYVWSRDRDPICAFAGSANYTQNAFSNMQMEVMADCDAKSAHSYYESLINNSIYCTHNEAEELLGIYKERRTKQQAKRPDQLPSHLAGLENVRINLLTDKGVMPARSRLNWGQRPDVGRDPNQAYIAIPATVYKTNFFPKRKVHFTVLTDDNKTIICSRAQDQGKGIHTPHNNALLGEYFRNRLGLPSGKFLTREHLERYGRTDIVFYKIDDETYHMDFSA